MSKAWRSIRGRQVITPGVKMNPLGIFVVGKDQPVAITMSRDPKSKEFKRFMKKMKTLTSEGVAFTMAVIEIKLS